jgi:hypothetical protein
MRKVPLLAVLVWIALVSGCAGPTIDFRPDFTATHDSSRDSQSVICVTSFDSSARLPVSYYATEDPRRVAAGFLTFWHPGAPPIACDRLNRNIGSGSMSFLIRQQMRVRGITGGDVEGAVLVLESFTPVDGSISVTVAESWNADIQDAGIGQTRDFAYFEVKSTNRGTRGNGSPPPFSYRLNSRPDPFIVRSRGGSMTIDVTQEVRDYFSESEQMSLDFMVVPASWGQNYKESNQAVGIFEFVLFITFSE